MMKYWRKKCEDDSETFNWISSNTKDCPKCGKATEKNGGCNHITCPCGAHWCWNCIKNFDEKTVYTHSCNKYIEPEDKKTARAALQRYLHYFHRYKNHEDSFKKEGQFRATIKRKVGEMYKLKPNSAWVEVQWLEAAMNALIEVCLLTHFD